jgi:hypothetical protein
MKIKHSVQGYLLMASAIALVLASCATSPETPEAAIAARIKLNQLQQNSQLASRAVVEIREAEQAVSAAEVPMENMALSEHLILMADQKVDIADAWARSRLYEDQRTALTARTDAVRLEARTREANFALSEARSARADADSAQQSATAARFQTQAAVDDATSARSASEQSREQALDARSQTQAALGEAESARRAAEISREQAELARSQAQVALTDASSARTAADVSREEAIVAQGQTEVALSEAAASRQTADAASAQTTASTCPARLATT